MRRAVSWLVAVLALAAWSPSTPARAEDGLDPVTSIPLPKMYGPTSLVAASQDVVVRAVWTASRKYEYEYSLDNGAGWKPAPQSVASFSLIGYRGLFYRMKLDDVVDGGEDCDSAKAGGFVIWDPVKGTTRTVDVTPEQGAVVIECPGIADAVANRVVLADGRVLDLSGSTARSLPVVFGEGAPENTRAIGISADGTTVLGRGSVWDAKKQAERQFLAVASTDGTTGRPAMEIPGLIGSAVAADRMHYLVGTKSKLAICRAPLADPTKPSCLTLRKGDSRNVDATLDVSQGVDEVIYRARHTTLWLRKGNTVKKVTTTATIRALLGTAFRDPSRPLVYGEHAAKGDVYGRVAPNGKVDWSIVSRKVPAYLASLAVTPNRVTAIDSRPFVDASPSPLWYRTFSGTTVGAEIRLAGPVDNSWRVYASGRRTVVDCCTSLKTGYYDDAKRVFHQRQKANANGLSGPYVATGDYVRRFDGVTYRTVRNPAIFGSLVATIPDLGRTITVRDLAKPSSTPITVTLPAGPEYWSTDLLMWGDWIGLTYFGGPDHDQVTALVRNYRTGESHTISGQVKALGDGYALIARYQPSHTEDDDVRTAYVWKYRTGQSQVLPVQSGYELATDGVGQLAWATETTIEVAKIQGVATTAPRLLGVLAPSSFKAGTTWKPAIDTSKPLNAGTLEIRTSKGKLVRSVATQATASGSLRKATWNGRDAKGRKVAAGTYTWTLKASARDGSGTVTDVTGRAAATGTVKVKR